MTYKSLLLILTTLFFFNCGRSISFDKKKLQDLEKITLLGVIITPEDQDDEDYFIKYPSTSFKFEFFLKNLLKTFNTNRQGIQINYLSKENQIKISTLKPPPLVNSFEKNLVFANKKDKEILNYIKLFDEEYYLIISYQINPWLQETTGYFKVYNRKKKLVWSEEISHISNYIIYDQKSPYLIKNKTIQVKSKKTSHYEELNEIFGKLGESVGVSLQETLDKIF